MARLRLLGGPAEEIPCVIIEASPTRRYNYGSLLRPWNLASLPRQLRDAALLSDDPVIRPHRKYPFGVLSFRKRIPSSVCRQLDIEEVKQRDH